MTLRSYKMTHDKGFAPNVYGNILSLATCKPQIRRVCEIGEWIAGFTSQEVNGQKVVEKKLIYLAKVSGKITFAEFWHYYEFKRAYKDDNGDNIYKPKGNGEYEQMPNAHHGCDCKEHDLSVDSVLLCEEFYYFSVGNALDLGNLLAKINVPTGQSAYGNKTTDEDEEILETDDKGGAVKQLIDLVRKNKDKCVRFKDENGKVGGKAHQSSSVASQSGSCGSSSVASAGKANSCGANGTGKKC